MIVGVCFLEDLLRREIFLWRFFCFCFYVVLMVIKLKYVFIDKLKEREIKVIIIIFDGLNLFLIFVWLVV